ncbi:MAG: pyrroline-5-carboxylate reductase [Elusimicrobiota bacterium]
MKKKKITVIGCGKMGSTIMVSIKRNIKQFNIKGVDKDSKVRKRIEKEKKIKVYSSLDKTQDSDIYILAVKPQDIDEVLKELSEIVKNADKYKWIISIAAGISSSRIRKYLKRNAGIVRVMPNTPALISEGMTVICEADSKSRQKRPKFVRKIFSTMGKTINSKEEYMDLVTALSGSGPAYFFLLSELMEKYAREKNMDSYSARMLAAQTVIGAGKLMMHEIENKGKSFEQLRKDVTSPGGTTEAALKYLKKKSFNQIFLQGLKKAENRSKELSGK